VCKAFKHTSKHLLKLEAFDKQPVSELLNRWLHWKTIFYQFLLYNAAKCSNNNSLYGSNNNNTTRAV